MSLRVKVELALFVVVGLVVGLTYTIQRFVVLPDLNPYEEKVAQKDMLDSINALRSEVTRLNSFCVDWSRGVDIINYVREAERDDAVVNITLDDLAKSSLSLVFVLDNDGDVVWGKVVDSDSSLEIESADFPKEHWGRSHPLLDRMASGVSIQGVMLTEVGPMLVASNPITDPMTKRSSGNLILGRRLDERFLSSIFENTSFAFRVWPVTDSSLPEEEAKIIQEIERRGLSHVTHVSDDMFRVYAVFPDVRGESALMLRSDVNRNVLAKAYEAMQLGLLVQVGVALAALVVLIVLFRRSVMNSLTELTNHTIRIGTTNDLSARLDFKRDDELGVLASEFDRMVAQLEEDLERRARTEEALRESEERYALAVKGANDGLWDWNLTTDEIHFSDRWKSMLGYAEHEVEDLPEEWLGRVHPDDRENVVMALDVHVKGQSAHFESEHRIRHKGDNYLWVLCRGIAVREDGESAARMAGSMSDITLRKLFEEQLSHQALHDSLTTLPNRALFLDRVSQAMKQVSRNDQEMFAVLFLDLDRFKVVNDGLGHVIGDTLLAAFAEKLTSSLRESDTVARNAGTIARFGGDEFVLLLDTISNISDATLVAERIQMMLKEPFVIEGHEIFTSVSVGIALSDPGYTSPEEVVRNADTAMYRAKRDGKARFAIFDSDMHEKAMDLLQLESDMRHGLDRGSEFIVHYQPIVCMDTGRVYAFEALVRWEHPERGLISPNQFIPIAEETGLIVPLGEVVMREACKRVRSWQMRVPGYEDLCVSVNLSPKQFASAQLLEMVQDALDEADLDPRSLKIEITESAMMESVDFVMNTLKRIRKMGVQLSIDDFGTGYSSLSYLHRFPMNTLKIDEAFVRNMHMADENMQIIKTILLLAQSLDMDVVAEGIETAEQYALLRDSHCAYGQGYYFAKPLDAEAAVVLLMSDPSWRNRVEV